MNQIEAKRAALAKRRETLIEQRRSIDVDLGKIDAQDEVLRELLGETVEALNGSHAAQILDTPHVNVFDAVHEIVRGFSRPFTKIDVFTALTASYPALKFSQRSVEKPLSRLRESRELLTLRKGNAKSPAVYQNTPLLAAENSNGASRSSEVNQLSGENAVLEAPR